MPYLHWEYSLACYHTMKIIEDARKVASEFKSRNGYELHATDISSLQCDANEKLLCHHITCKTWHHMRRTLDQSYYPTIRDTHLRDQDQVVERYSRKQQGDSWGAHRVLIVDQLWLWVLGDHTVLTCFSETFSCYSSERYLKDETKSARIKNAEDLAYCIADRCAGNIYDSELMPDQSFDFLEMFRRSIVDLMDRQSLLFRKVLIILEPGSDEAGRSLDAEGEFELLVEAKDILNELRIIWDINKQQSSVLKSLERNSFSKNSVQVSRKRKFLEEKPKARAEVVQDLYEKGDAAYQAIHHLLDLKQKQASLYEARSATKMVRESEKSGETIMLFTIITILFLPLSTLASIFGLNAKEPNAGNLPLGIVFAYICLFLFDLYTLKRDLLMTQLVPVSVLIIVISLVLAFNDSARKTLITPFTKRGEAYRVAKKQRKAGGRISGRRS